MITATVGRALNRLGRWLEGRSAPRLLGGRHWMGLSQIDAHRLRRPPTANELLQELKNTAFTCASLNAAACASYPPRLYVATDKGQPEPQCPTKSLKRSAEDRLRGSPSLPAAMARARQIAEVVDHPLLTLLRQVNPVHNSFDLWELTTFYQEVVGSAYWLLRFGPLNVPEEIWILPAQNVVALRRPDSPRLVDGYECRSSTGAEILRPEEVIHFRYPDPKDPYAAGLSPLRACWEQALLTSEYLAFKQATWENHAVPGVVVAPDEVIGEEERDRLEQQWNNTFRRGGAGRAFFTESGVKVSILSHSIGDLAALAEYGKTKEDVANAFHVPLAFLTSDTNLANLQAAEHQHLAKAIFPRLQRRDEKLNEQLVPLFDSTGRLFVASDDPVPLNQELGYKRIAADLRYGILTVNEIRQDRGLAPVPWGDTPWLPVNWAPTDFPDRAELAPESGRARRSIRARGLKGKKSARAAGPRGSRSDRTGRTVLNGPALTPPEPGASGTGEEASS